MRALEGQHQSLLWAWCPVGLCVWVRPATPELWESLYWGLEEWVLGPLLLPGVPSAAVGAVWGWVLQVGFCVLPW